MIWLAMTLIAITKALTDSTADGQRARFEHGQAVQSAFEEKLFEEAGFEPLRSIIEQARDVRRVWASDPYMMLPTAGVELERFQDGRVTLTVISKTGRTKPVELLPGDWASLDEQAGGVFAHQVFKPWKEPVTPPPLPPPPPICHSWIVRFGATLKTKPVTQSWSMCGGEDQHPERLTYALMMLKLAVKTRPSCHFESSNPFWSFGQCFHAPVVRSSSG